MMYDKEYARVLNELMKSQREAGYWAGRHANVGMTVFMCMLTSVTTLVIYKKRTEKKKESAD